MRLRVSAQSYYQAPPSGWTFFSLNQDRFQSYGFGQCEAESRLHSPRDVRDDSWRR
jgi:hypothetical protein